MSIDRRKFLTQSALYAFLLAEGPWPTRSNAEDFLQGGPSPAPVPEPDFPDRLHLFVWRNWELANTERMAKILGTTQEKVIAIGTSMGLPEKPRLTDDELRRIYVTVIRQNWHILPHAQIIELLGWTRQHYEYTLREDDFLWIKLGGLKPRCERLTYTPPSREARERAAQIKELVHNAFGPLLRESGEPPFEFVRELSSRKIKSLRDPRSRPSAGEVDLSQGWTLIKPNGGSGVSADLARDLQAYLREAFGCRVNLGESNTAGAKTLKLLLNPSITPTGGSFEINVQPGEIRIIGKDARGLREAIFHLEDQWVERGGPYLHQGSIRRTTTFNPRYVYSYFALYGDPLIDERIDPFPDGFLEKLARSGINGVWLQAILRNMAPSKLFPEFGKGSQTRLRNLASLVERADRYGVKIYFYLNEPRSMPADFFRRHPNIRGTYDPPNRDFYAMCTSTSEVRQWLSDSLAHIFSHVPKLGGIFCITASENLTNCFSHGHPEFCPRCSKRNGSAVIAELIATFRNGIRRSNPVADVIAEDWGWDPDWVRHCCNTADVVRRLPKDVSLLSISEWDIPIDRGGHRTKVGEYSISAVGPGPRAKKHWELARKQGLTNMAKVQWSNTWEISAVPYIPVPNLIVEHSENLLKQGIHGVMASWTVGGYPSPNFEAAKEFYFSPAPQGDETLRRVAVRRYGKKAAPDILRAWKTFSTAFVQYPMEGGGVVYHIPVQHGPANPLRIHPTGYKAGMMLFPYDDYKDWVGSYPVAVVEKQFEKMARLWEPGLTIFRRALARVPAQKLATAQKDLGIAETCYIHFQSVANQIRFYRLRDKRASVEPDQRRAIAAEMIKIAEAEIQLAERQFAIARHDSTIAYEASNHYYYRPLDLVEKVLNCRDLIHTLRKSAGT